MSVAELMAAVKNDDSRIFNRLIYLIVIIGYKIDYEEEIIQGQLSNEKKRRSFVDLRSLDVPGSHLSLSD